MKVNETYLSPLRSTARIDQRQKTAAPASAKPARRFDTVMISNPKRAEGSDAATRLRESISLDVRSAVAAEADRIPTLREQIRSGAYQIDPTAIARRMLMLGENR